MMEITLFTSSKCVRCPAAKKWAKKNINHCKIIEVDKNDENIGLAKKLGVKSVPTFVIKTDNVFGYTYTFSEFVEMWSK